VDGRRQGHFKALGLLFGFGPFAGFLTLTISTIGFLSKLLADDIEEIEPTQVEAIRALAASGLKMVRNQVRNCAQPAPSSRVARMVSICPMRIEIVFRRMAASPASDQCRRHCKRPPMPALSMRQPTPP
jgi:hypothetical protein